MGIVLYIDYRSQIYEEKTFYLFVSSLEKHKAEKYKRKTVFHHIKIHIHKRETIISIPKKKELFTRKQKIGRENHSRAYNNNKLHHPLFCDL